MRNNVSGTIDVKTSTLMEDTMEELILVMNRDSILNMVKLKCDGHSNAEIANLTNRSEEDVRYFLDMVRKHIDLMKSKK